MNVRQPFAQVDAFTDQPFAGNPAAVCVLAAPRSVEWMQLVAREMNLAETAYLIRQADGYDLRWFTPACEVDLCGHATLASAHLLWEEERLPLNAKGRFHTRSGLLTAEKRDSMIWLDFPATPPTPADASLAPEFERALGVALQSVWRTPFDYVAEVDSENTVRNLDPDLGLVARIGGRGVIVTALATASGRGYDFVSRFFAPAVGVPEDPVTGSAHCALAPFWGERLGCAELIGYQASSRGGMVRVRLTGDRVQLGGHAVTVARGQLLH